MDSAKIVEEKALPPNRDGEAEVEKFQVGIVEDVDVKVGQSTELLNNIFALEFNTFQPKFDALSMLSLSVSLLGTWEALCRYSSIHRVATERYIIDTNDRTQHHRLRSSQWRTSCSYIRIHQ